MKTIIIMIAGSLLSVGWGSCQSQTNQTFLQDDARTRFQAEVEKMGKHLVEVCDTVIMHYDSFNRVQEAFATVNLSGLHDVLIRPKGQLGPSGIPTSYDLLVPHDSAITAGAALRATNTCELTRLEEFTNAFSVVSTLRARSIQATIRPVKKNEQDISDQRLFAVYVRRLDEKAAQACLAER